MKSKEDKTRELSALFALSRDAVLGVTCSRVAFANAAAERLFGRALQGEALGAVLPELDAALCREGGVTAAEIGRTRHTVSVVAQGEWAVVTILRETASPGEVSAALLSRLRSAAFSLRFSLDRLLSAAPSDDSAQVAWHSFFTLQHLIGQLSDAQDLARGELALREQTLDLAALVRDLTGSAAFFTGDRGVEIRCEVEPGDWPFRGDRDRIEQLVLILLANSLEHTPPGGTIRTALRRSYRRYVLSVDDDGEGMDETALAYAFTPRPAAGPEDAAGGAGLGLYIASELARVHGGSVVLQSERGKGTRVRVTLPAGDGLCLRDDAAPEARGPERLLTELCGVLPAAAYDRKYRD